MSQQPPRKPRRQLQGGRSSRAPRALGHAGRHWEALGRTGSLPPTLPQRGSSLVGSVPVPEPRFPSWHRGARGGVTVPGDIPTGAQETGGCAGCVGSAAQPDAGLAVIILIAADIFGSGAADVFAAPRLLQRAAAQPGQAPAVQPRGGGGCDASRWGPPGAARAHGDGQDLRLDSSEQNKKRLVLPARGALRTGPLAITHGRGAGKRPRAKK